MGATAPTLGLFARECVMLAQLCEHGHSFTHSWVLVPFYLILSFQIASKPSLALTIQHISLVFENFSYKHSIPSDKDGTICCSIDVSFEFREQPIVECLYMKKPFGYPMMWALPHQSFEPLPSFIEAFKIMLLEEIENVPIGILIDCSAKCTHALQQLDSSRLNLKGGGLHSWSGDARLQPLS
ncbi:uncharacterized protein G2W53_008092 [Senna tora]|uniref:Uncharacterized protein n=1 Tax=Senna tora TaxID=362788 RepID=A0A835CGM0_9FABA|nr:uncharacterized protein G2W53_008092 [Senna tora]